MINAPVPFAVLQIGPTAGNWTSQTLTEYLNDSNNPTGYTQVLRATQSDPTTNQIQQVTEYAIGLRQISQTTTPYSNGQPGTPSTLTFGFDARGSVRVLINPAGAVATLAGVPQVFNYAAYGNAIGFNVAAAATSLLYNGQQTDAPTGLQYLRARYYDSRTGNFTTLDPAAGNPSRPQSYNTYVYTQGDPVNGYDPSGRDLADVLATISIVAVGNGLLLGGLNAWRTGGGLNAFGFGFFRGALIGAEAGLAFAVAFASGPETVAETTISAIVGGVTGMAIDWLACYWMKQPTPGPYDLFVDFEVGAVNGAISASFSGAFGGSPLVAMLMSGGLSAFSDEIGNIGSPHPTPQSTILINALTAAGMSYLTSGFWGGFDAKKLNVAKAAIGNNPSVLREALKAAFEQLIIGGGPGWLGRELGILIGKW